MDASNQALVRQSPNKAFYHATEKGCSMEARVHLEKFVIKARHEVSSRHGQCNDLNALHLKNESSEMTLGRSPCENE